ncbi:MAG: long-chain fatty acid--CoA ligase [Ruminococcaceae bacterium]|nr:long-chain fatty acid--CoA ligase [Oscillospiraceae bacterium]
MKVIEKPLYEVAKIRDLKDMLTQSVEKFGPKAAFLSKVDGKYEPISYNQFGADVQAMGTALMHRGFGGKKIAVIGENRYEWDVTYMAVVNGVGVIVPIDKELPEKEILQLVATAGVDAIMYAPKNEKVVQNAPVSAKFNMETDFVPLLEEGRKLLEEGDRSYLDIEIDPEEMRILLFTSGTTSNAKAVMLNHRNIAENLMGMCAMTFIGPEDVFLSVLPIHHTYECTCGFLCQIYRGTTVAYSDGLRYITKNLAECKATMMLGVPLLLETMYNKVWKQAEKSGRAKKLRMGIKISRMLLKLGIDKRRELFKEIHNNLGGNLRMLIAGAAAIDPKVAEGLRDFGIEAIQGYGLTECAPIAALNRDCNYRDAAAGLPLPGVEIKIDNPDENGIGEIVIHGKNVMMGYYNNPQATAEVLKDGWFYSGDYGYIDKDGFVYITGRKKNVIVTKNGKNIFPEEIEAYLNRAPIVAESMVYGIDLPDGDAQIAVQILPDLEEAKAVLGENYTDEQLQKAVEEAVKEVNDSLQGYKRVSKVIVRKEDFEKTTTKKIKRHVEMAKMKNE